MRSKSHILIVLLISIVPLMARSENSGNMLIFRSLTIAIMDGYVTDNKQLPTSWDDIPMIRNMKGDPSVQNPRELKVINMLALVPNAPVLEITHGVSPRLRGMKLFAISRFESVDPVFSKKADDLMEGGRYLILVSQDMSDIIVNWISEPEAKLVLRQLREFDPAKQPLAFADVTESERALETKKELFNGQIRDAYNKQIPQMPKNEGLKHNSQKPREYSPLDSNESIDAKVTRSFGCWSIAGLAVLASIIAWLKLRRAKS